MASSVSGGDGLQTKIFSQTNTKTSSLSGRPVQIVQTLDDHTFDLNEEALEHVLLDPRVRDKKLVVLSVAGAFRKGKSFFLDFCLRYLHAQGSPEWLGADSAALEGFSWRGGADRDTTGILLWSEPFIQTLPTGEQVAVLLMDTQGAFDSMSTVKDCATVFALSTLLSSVQVYNIMLNIQEDDLQHLQLFTEYGRLAQEDYGAKPFQNLTFLVRDWQYPYEFEYGSNGGEKLLDKRLQITDNQHMELQQLRKHIRSCFNKLSCCLMPHPGLKVATNPHFDGRLSDINQEFKEELQNIIPRLLSRQNLVIKEINGSKITGKELVEYFKAYVKMYQGDEIPEPKSMLLATAEANNLTAVASAKDFYTREMEQICGGDKPYIGPELLLVQHTRCKDGAVQQFVSTRKMGGAEFCQSYKDKLEAELVDLYDQYVRHNESKNLFAAAKTPAVLFTITVALYIASGLLGMLGITPVANLVNLAMLAVLGVLMIWVYVRYTGEYREVSVFIDQLAESAWEGALGPVWMRIMQGGATHAVQQRTGVSLHRQPSNNNKKNS